MAGRTKNGGGLYGPRKRLRPFTVDLAHFWFRAKMMGVGGGDWLCSMSQLPKYATTSKNQSEKTIDVFGFRNYNEVLFGNVSEVKQTNKQTKFIAVQLDNVQ